MAHLVRQKTTHSLDTAGTRVPPGTRGAKKVVSISKKWYGAGILGTGKKRVPLAADKRVAQKMLADLVERGERGVAGMADKAEAGMALEPLLKEFEAALRRAAKPPHVHQVMHDIRRVSAGCKLKTVADLRAADLAVRVETFVWSLTTDEGGPLSAPTAAQVGKHARQFTRWLWRKRKALDSDPLAGMDLPSQAVVGKRRAFTAEELAKLIEAAMTSTHKVQKIPSAERVAIYSLAVTTGFRVTELARLLPTDFDLDADPPMVRLAGKFTKNGEDAALPVAPAVVRLLRPILATRAAGVPVWPGKWQDRAARMIRKDMAAAGIAERTDAGRADFHSLRHTFITIIGSSSPLKVLQELTRHSTPILTVGRYSHAGLTEKAEAVGRIPLSASTESAGPFSAMPRAQLEAVATALAAVVLAILDTPRDTPELETGRDRTRGMDTDAAEPPKKRADKSRKKN